MAVTSAGSATRTIVSFISSVTGECTSTVTPFILGDHPQIAPESLGDFYDATWVHVRAAVSFATVFLILAVVLWRTARGSLAQRLSVAGVVLTLCQLAVGEYQYRNGLPWEVIAVHVAIAGTLVMTIVTVASLVAYPPSSRVAGSLERG